VVPPLSLASLLGGIDEKPRTSHPRSERLLVSTMAKGTGGEAKDYPVRFKIAGGFGK
jgi:hypothetical protein